MVLLIGKKYKSINSFKEKSSQAPDHVRILICNTRKRFRLDTQKEDHKLGLHS